MFKIIDYPFEPNSPIVQSMARRTSPPSDAMEQAVRQAYAEVTQKGQVAIAEYTAKFDAPGFTADNIFVSKEYVQASIDGLKPDVRSAIDVAIHNIGAVNKQIVSTITPWDITIAEGHKVGERPFPLDSVLLWAPSRKAPLVSTAIMLCNAAKEAGVKKIIVATPPGTNGLANPDTFAASALAGATHFVCGNALAVIASAATGHWDLGKVNAIYGPGPDVVALTMLQAARYGIVTQPGVGPSDSLVLFDKITADEAKILARDVLTETEHGADSYTYALTTNRESALLLQEALKNEASHLFGRDKIYEEIAKNDGAAIVVFEDEGKMIDFANSFCAEHLMIFMDSPQAEGIAEKLSGASEMLIGKSVPFSAANYCIGVTAVLPTNGFARSYSGITSRQFFRYATRAQLTAPALEKLIPSIESIGRSEGLLNHAQAATVRKLTP